MIAQLSSGHIDGADALYLLAVVLFAVGWLLHVTGPSTVAPRLLNGVSFALLGLAAIALALFIT